MAGLRSLRINVIRNAAIEKIDQIKMKLYNSRNKLVTFRLTDHEYDAVRNLCISKGFKSVSELTRESLLQQLSSDRQPRSLVIADLVTLLSGLERIDGTMKDLIDQIARVLGPTSRSAISLMAPGERSLTSERSLTKGAAK